MNIKKMSVFVLFVISLIAASAVASAAVNVDIDFVKVNGDEFGGGINVIQQDKDDSIEIRVSATNNGNETAENVQVSASIRGNERDLIEDITDTFDMKAGVSYIKKLTLDLPQRMDQNTYTLFVRVEDNSGVLAEDESSFRLEIDGKQHDVEIRDIILSPEENIKAGRALLVTARVKNFGEQEEEDIKVKATIPELGLSASDYIDQLDPEGGDDDSTTSEELYLRIPDCAEAGEYTVQVCAEFDDGDEETCETTSIEIVESDLCPAFVPPADTESKTIITIGPESQSIDAGDSAAYSVTITNQGTESKSYTVSADAGNWATTTITPTNVIVLSPGESKTVMVNVAPNEGASGEQIFSVTISSGDKVLKQVPLKADVDKASNLSSIKRGLEIGLVILVVLLVVLALIIGFNRLKGNEEPAEKEETYY
ncbi:MAG TPA: putative S-layer protein [Candidatus Nanoarchaeia archaeon]|nr:putative S-layer protein [Candidatus Nanoarchaeia archaeon]